MTRRPGPPPTKPCGTRAAYQRHIRNGQPACRACLEAVRGEQAAKRQAERAARRAAA
jgi:hypothetical protein